jgi:hypothetical protein
MRLLDVSRVGMQLAERQLDRAASNLARASVPGAEVDVAKEIVSLQTAKASNAANVAVARTASEVMGTLVDMMV